MSPILDSSLSPVSLLTFVLQEHHCQILDDWIRFLELPIEAVIVHVGSDIAITERLNELCDKNGVRLDILGVTNPQETTNDEARLLAEQFDAVKSGFGCIVRLDTIPYRNNNVAWRQAGIKLMEQTGACFITGSTLPYRADRPTSDPGFLLTQRISNCFLMITPETWRKLQKGTPESPAKYGRFMVEGAPEDYLAAHNLWGLRLVNRSEIRVFHCQEWGMRLLDVRSAFIEGRRIIPFLRGWQDDFFGAKARYYMRPGLPMWRRVRITLGRWRRQLFDQ